MTDNTQPPERSRPMVFGPKDVILNCPGGVWRFSVADAMRFLKADIDAYHPPPRCADYGGEFIEGAIVLDLSNDDDWNRENLKEFARMLEHPHKFPCDGCDGSGVRVPASPSCTFKKKLIPNGWAVLEKCDACAKYHSDLEAGCANFRDVEEVRCDSGGRHTLVAMDSRKEHHETPASPDHPA